MKIGEGSLSQLPPTIVNSTISLNSLPWYISELIVLDNTWNDVVMLDLREFSLLKQITVGTNALQNVREIHLESLPLLERLVIGDHSLTSNYLYGFSLIQMNSLKTIQIGKNSLTHPNSLQFNGLTSLQALSIGEGSFELVETVVIANRYTTANAYHQLSKMDRADWDAFLAWLWDFEYQKLGLPSPDRVILVDVPQSVSDANVEKRSRETGAVKDIHEKDREYLHRCREAALYVAEACGWTVLSCADEEGVQFPVEVIGEAVRNALADLIS